VAVIEWGEPLTERLLTVSDACPLVSSVPVPSVLAPSLNVTVPVGAPAPGGVTETVVTNVTGWPNVEGEPGADVGVPAVVPALLTVWPPASVPLTAVLKPSPL